MAIIIILILIALFFILVKKRLLIYQLPNVSLVTGGVKCGKTALSLALAIKRYKKLLINYYLSFKNKDKPVFYSNIPLKLKGVKMLELEHILLEKRLSPNCVVFVDESSLLAHSMLYKNIDLNTSIMLFNKLFAHITHGGYLFYNTQSIEDLHYNIKRCLNSYINVERLIRFPFFSVAKCRIFDSLTDTINTTSDIDRRNYNYIFFFNSIFKKYNRYNFSPITDKKLIDNNNFIINNNFNSDYLLSFDTNLSDKYSFEINKEVKDNEDNQEN